MKKVPKINKLLALILALVLFTSSSVGVYAGDEENVASVESLDESAPKAEETVAAVGETASTGSDESAEGEAKAEEISEEGNSTGDNPTVAADGENSDEVTGGDAAEENKNGSASVEGENAEGEKAEDENQKQADIEADDISTNAGDAVTDKKAEVKGSANELTEEKKLELEKNKKDADKDCEHTDVKYIANSDGKTHSVICADCDELLDEEDCEFGDDGYCIKGCGNYDEEHDKTKKNKDVQKAFTISDLKVGEYLIDVSVPEDTFNEKEVTADSFKAEVIDDFSKTSAVESAYKVGSLKKYVAFDFKFMVGDEKATIKDGGKVTITIKSLGFKADAVAHFSGSDVEQLEVKSADENSVAFEASSFSPYVVAELGESVAEDTNGGGVLYGSDTEKSERSAYGYAYTKEDHFEGTSTVAAAYKTGRYALRISHYTTGFSYIAPTEEDKFFIYSDTYKDGKFHFHFEAPTNYYIDYVGLGNEETETIDPKYSPIEKYATVFDQEIQLTPMGDDKKVNYLIVSLQPIPVKLNSETAVVKGASFVKYVDYTTVFGNAFKFNDGATNKADACESNVCHFDQIYQGLGSNKFSSENGFQLNQSSGSLPFPNYDEYSENKSAYSYIKKYYANAGVTFNKDTDGYWTLDSSQNLYTLKEIDGVQTLVPESSENGQFRPFGSDVHHFGMALPIDFSINSDGKTNGKDTIFKFSGDDDVFVYVDDTLVLDLGGIHDCIRGQINFTTGEILIQGDYMGKLTSSVDAKNSVYACKSLGDKNLYDTLGTDLGSFANKEHRLTVVYFERGRYLSNCRISYNFNMDEKIDVEYEGFKVKADGETPLNGAEFTLYTDEACTKVAQIGIGVDAVAVSGKDCTDGTIKFAGLSVGILTSSKSEVSETYYMKETKAAEGYITPSNAVWKLEITASAKSSSSKLTAITDEAKKLSLHKSGEASAVAAVKNDEAKTFTGHFNAFKVNEKNEAVKGAEFTLYKANTFADADVVSKVTTDAQTGAFEFKDLEVGTITDTVTSSVTKTYYLKETKAREGYVLPEGAVWELTFTGNASDTTTDVEGVLTAAADSKEAKELLTTVTKDGKSIPAIVNRKKAPGYLIIKKTLKTFVKAQGPASFVFEVSYTDPTDDSEHSYVYGLNFEDAGSDQTEKIEVPADTKITVKEVYSGACYELISSENTTPTVEAGETQTVKFVNDYDGRDNHGGIGITNVFDTVKKLVKRLFQ